MVTCIKVVVLDDSRMAAKVDERLERPYYQLIETMPFQWKWQVGMAMRRCGKGGSEKLD